MELKELIEELKGAKHKEIDIYFLSSQRAVKGILKNVEGDIEVEEGKYIDISLKEMKSDEEVLENFKCGGCGKKGKGRNNQDRKIIRLGNLEDIKKIQKMTPPSSVRYKIDIEGGEELGIVVVNK